MSKYPYYTEAQAERAESAELLLKQLLNQTLTYFRANSLDVPENLLDVIRRVYIQLSQESDELWLGDLLWSEIDHEDD